MSGVGGGTSFPFPGLGSAGSISSAPPGPALGAVPTNSEPAGGSSSSDEPVDAGAPPAPVEPEPDAGAPGGGPTPGPVEVPACVGSALELDGATYAAVPRMVADDFTLEAWVKTEESLTASSAFLGRALFDSDVIGMGNQNDFQVSVLNDRLAFAVGGPDTTVQGVTVMTSGQWVHVAVTRQASSGQLQVFLNGALQALAMAPNRNALTGRPDLALGGFVSTRKFIGAIDEVRIWNVLRSGAQISASLRERLSGSEPGLVGYYTFEERGPSQAADTSALGIAATLTGNPTYVASSALCEPGPTR